MVGRQVLALVIGVRVPARQQGKGACRLRKEVVGIAIVRRMDSCVFCSLPAVRQRFIVATRLSAAFPTNIPIVPGHTILIPRRHIARWDELTPAEQADLEALRQRICAALRHAFGAEGFNFAWNEGKVAGQSIPHLHLHVLPRKQGDTGVWQYEPRRFLYRPGSRAPSPEEELQEVAALIRAHLPPQRE